jgi:monooxygenase
MSLPSADNVTAWLARVLPPGWAFGLARRRNVAVALWLYRASRRWPERMRALLLGQVRKQLRGTDVDMRHFTPSYQPWDQRLCFMPDADLFRAIRSGQAGVVTDTIVGFDGNQLRLQSGASLDADVLVTATGLQVQALGGAQIFVDGQAWQAGRHMLYKGVLLEGLPNAAWIIGYINASWTLKLDLAAAYQCRLLRHMDEHGFAVATPHDARGCKAADDESIFDALSAGYVARAKGQLPLQGREHPWRVTHDYPSDRRMLLDEPVDDGVLRFAAPNPAQAMHDEDVAAARGASSDLMAT